ncbi:zinc ribbon domain-containing protein (plasmid) [Elizabethkingia anophelis]|uniref:zinc ribbon domain-containing protein n=1 Tax=Elizabethkingia anophelis TaxID=1117645 RepID=UPI0020B8CC81|nr:zinc ribbon domain-containing protein [Elizabethkingia anophelis]UTG66809.1 zinc ribbon domain-containing protein [Elizabethkingia anophelis]
MLINCPECNKEISDQANACPNCGYALKKTPKPSQGCFMQTLNAGCLIFVIIFVIIIIGAVMNGITMNKGKNANSSISKTEKSNGN